jgi:hypothetical protein
MIPFAFWKATGAPAPVVTAISPAVLDTAGGGQPVTITGSNFTGATGVTIGGTVATSVTVVNATTITCLPGARAAGAGLSVIVTKPSGSNGANTLAEYWSPASDGTCTLLFDAVSNPYNAITGIWTPRHSPVVAASTAQLANLGATKHAAVGGGPSFDGNGAVEAGMRQTAWTSTSTPPRWRDFLGVISGSALAGTVAAVFKSSNTNALFTGDGSTAYLNPTVVGSMDASSGTLGIGFGNNGSTPSACAHIYDATLANYKGIAAAASAGSLHAVVSRWGTAASTFDLSVDGALSGAGFATTSTDGNFSSFLDYPMSLGLQYPDSSVANQTFNGELRAVAVFSAKVPDATIAKLYGWSRQRFGVA